jgi:hypothetical protein
MATAPPKREDSHPSSHNLAARMARWSSKHRTKAFWGWPTTQRSLLTKPAFVHSRRQC